MAGNADDEYVCTLDEASLQKAKEELYEDPKNRQGAVDTFKEWIIQQKHIKCPTDTRFLLRFLRARKFSQLEARKLLENYLARKQKLKQWFLNLDPGAAIVQDIMRSGSFLVLPGRDPEGRKIIILRFGSINIKKYTKHDLFRAIACLIESAAEDEMTQVNGIVQLVDFTGMTLKHQTFMSLEDRKAFIQTWQKHFPMRIKSIHVYNCGAFIEFVLMIIKFAMTEKMQKRLTTYSSLDNLYKVIPMEMWPEEYLPDDYTGPSAGTILQIADGMAKDLAKQQMVQRIQYISKEDFTADLSSKPDDIPQASFRKLNID